MLRQRLSAAINVARLGQAAHINRVNILPRNVVNDDRNHFNNLLGKPLTLYRLGKSEKEIEEGKYKQIKGSNQKRRNGRPQNATEYSVKIKTIDNR